MESIFSLIHKFNLSKIILIKKLDIIPMITKNPKKPIIKKNLSGNIIN